MPIAIYALAMINFAIGTQGFAFSGVLPEMADGLGITVSHAGLFIAATAITFAISSPIAAALTGGLDKRRVILVALTLLATLNLLCAWAPTADVMMSLRIAVGLSTAFAGALTTVVAATLVPAGLRGRAFALVTGGLTLAFVLGVPLGSVVGGLFGWRASFIFSAGVSAASALLVGWLVPAVRTAAPQPLSFGLLRSQQGVFRPLLLTLMAFTATFTVVAYLGPIITAATGATGAGVGALQAFIGLGSIVGLLIGGRSADRLHGRSASAIALAVIALSLAAYWPVFTAPPGTVSSWALAALIFVGATALFALIPINLTLIAASADDAMPVALALNGSLVALGQGLGAAWGGWLTSGFGAWAMAPGGALIALAGMLIAARALSPPGVLQHSQ